MCCFSRPVEFVRATRIFARPAADGHQVLIYQMEVGAPTELAMILPIPVSRGSGERAVKFVDLQHFPKFFTEMEDGFPQPVSLSAAGSDRGSRGRLRVESVGNYVASFVPTVRDFDRLDPRFRLPAGVWDKLGVYADYGFAVFQLKPGRAEIHPMAFTFPTALAGRLFFPTVHIHDGKAHRQANFDHLLYAQVAKAGHRALVDWRESELPASRFIKIKSALGLVLGDRHVFRRGMTGKLANEDVTLAAA